MAAGDRTKRIRSKIQRLCNDPHGITLANQDKVFDVLNLIQNRICEETGAKQVKTTISVVANTELYDYPSGFISESAILGGSTTPLEKKSIAEIAEIKRVGTQSTTSTADPMYYYKWNNQFGFTNAAGGAPSGASTITLYGWRIPLIDGSEDVSDSIDPIVNTRWDNCFVMGGVALLTGDPKYLTLYETEYARVRSQEVSYTDLTFRIPVTDEFS